MNPNKQKFSLNAAFNMALTGLLYLLDVSFPYFEVMHLILLELGIPRILLARSQRMI